MMQKIEKKSANCRVDFTYSDIYDAHFQADFSAAKMQGEYPSTEKIKDFLGRLESEWRIHESSIFQAIAEVTGCTWSVNQHTCYVVGSAVPFSDPLTMPVFQPQAPIDYAADVLTHEMIHRFLIQPELEISIQNVLQAARKRFVGENENVIIHVVVHAIHDLVFHKVFSAARLAREKKIMSAARDYKRAWELVDSVGAQMLVDDFFGKK